jgi:hypothetical protein
MKNIFEIEQKYLSIIDEIEANEGELTPSIETALAINEGEIKQKSMAYVSVIKNMESDVQTIDSEIKRLQALKKSRGNIVQRLKDTLQNALILFDIPEIKTELCKISFRKSKSVVVDDITLLPKECKTTTISITPDKKKIKELIESGIKLEGAYISENKNLQIK